MLSLRSLQCSRPNSVLARYRGNIVSVGRNSIRCLSGSDDENSSKPVTVGKSDAMAEFLASRQAFLRNRQKGQYLQSHAKGPGGRSGQKPGGQQGQGNNDQNNREHRSHYRKGKTFQKSQHVRGGAGEGSFPTRKGGHGKVNRRKHQGHQPFDQGFLTTFDADGKHRERDWAEELFYPDMLEVDDVDKWLQQDGPIQRKLLAPESLNKVVPLQIENDTFEDFLYSSLMHPTKFAEVSNEGWHVHPESRREAEPITVSLKQPKVSFLRRWKAFIHIENIDLPPDVEGDERLAMMRQQLFRFCKFSDRDIFQSSRNSAWVGFPHESVCTKAVARNHLKVQGPSVEVKKYVPTFGSEQEDDEALAFKEFLNNSIKGSSFLQVRNLPLKHKNWLRKRLHAIFSETLEVSNEDIFIKSADSALIRVKNATLANEILDQLFSEKLKSMVRCFEDAKRFVVRRCELEMQQKMVGVKDDRLCYVPGRRLIINGSVPSGNFYISHAGVICLDSVPEVSKEEISSVFDKYCVDKRDVLGSIQILKCEKGDRTGRVFVGFDRDDDFQAALKDLENETLVIAGKKVKVRPMKDKTKWLPEIQKLGSRGDRSTEELLVDLSDWEQHIEPDVLSKLDEIYGKEMLAEVFTHLRMKNMSFGALDQARPGERLEPHLELGARKKEFISYYASILLELYTTPENPGLLIESMFLDGEPVDLEAFDGPRNYVKVDKSS